MRVPFLDLVAQLETTRPGVERALLEVVASGRYVGGPVLESFERAMAGRVGASHAIGVSSGTDALLVSLMALEVGPGDVVVTTPYTFFATAAAVVRLGATPAFVDIDPRTFNVDPAALADWFDRESEQRARVKAIVPVHLFGQCADMAPILALAAAHGVPVVEDAAQGLDARYPSAGGDGTGRAGRPAGAMGTLGCFSFYPTKNLGAMGEAGLVVTPDAGLAERVRRLRNHGAHPAYRHAMVGGNFRLDTLQAAVLSAKLPYLDRWNEQRRERAAHYDAHLAVAGVELPAAAWGRDSHTWQQYVVRVPERRDDLRAHLAARQIDTMVYYPEPLHRQPCFRELGCGLGAFPNSEDAATRSLALPIYPELTPAMQDRVMEEIAAFYR